MKIALLQTKSRKKGFVNKDVSGGMGTVSHFGDSFMARILTFLKKEGINYPVLAMGYLAGILKERGHVVSVVSDAAPPEETDLVIIYSSIVDFRNEIEYVRRIKEQICAKICIVGPFATVKPEIYLPHVDFVIKGEPESFFMKFDLRSPLPNGIVEAGIVENLDTLPFPDWEIFPLDSFKYKPYFMFSGGKRFFPIVSSRGCTFSCASYCPYPITAGKKWRDRSPNNVVDEIEFLVRKLNACLLLFRDPIFTINKERVSLIAREIMKRKIDVHYVCETHLNCLDEALIDLLYDSGLRAIKVGIESANKTILSNTGRKPINTEHQERILNYCDKKKIAVTAFYILGLPDDTEQSILETIEYAKKLNTIGAQFTISTPYPGTQFFQDMDKANLILDYDFENYDIHTPVYKHKNLSKEQLIKLKGKAYNSYYFRLKWISKFIKTKVLAS